MARAHNIMVGAARRIRWERYHANPERWFWDRVDSSGGEDQCWPWKGRVVAARRGYGRLVFKGRHIGAHRMALTLMVGCPDESLFACHRCDNPVCCNPNHLFWGTPQDNVDDCCNKGRKRGAPPLIDLAKTELLRSQGYTYAQIAACFGVNQASIGKALQRAAALKARARQERSS